MAKNKEHSARSKGDRRLCFERVMRRLAKQAVPSRFLISFDLCGAAIGDLFLEIYKVACFPFWKMSSSVIFVFYGFRKAVNLCIPRGRMISAPTRLQYTSAAVFSAGEQSSPLRCADDNSPQTEPIKGGFMPHEHPAKHLRYDFPRGFSGMGIFYTKKDSFFAVL